MTEPVRQVVQPVGEGLDRTAEAVAELLEPVRLPQAQLPNVPSPVDSGAKGPEALPGQAAPAGGSGDAVSAGAPRPDTAYHPMLERNIRAASNPAHPVAQLPRPAAPSAPAPLQAPGAPHGLGAHSTAESSTQRHADAQPATLPDRHLGVPSAVGKGAPTSYDRIRDRHRDVLEFPG